MRRYFVIETPEQLRAISDPLRIRLLTMLITQEATGKQLADQLQIPASKVHYHLRELEHYGFVEVVRTEEKNGIVQKFFRAVAIDYVVSENLLPSGYLDASVMQEVLANQLRMALTRVYETPEQFFQVSSSGARLPLIHGVVEVRADREALLAWQAKCKAVMTELLDMNRSGGDTASSREGPHTNEVFFMVTVGFMTDTESFQVDHPGMPDGYQIQEDPRTGEITAKRKESIE